MLVARRVIGNVPDLAVAAFLVEPRCLEFEGVEPQPDAAPFPRQVFGHLHQFRTQALSPGLFRHHQQVDVQPLVKQSAMQAAEDLVVVVAHQQGDVLGHVAFGFRAVVRAQWLEDGLALFIRGVLR
ncbi:hypothetical protein D9M69_636860 [compost metagenome]